MKRLQPDRIDDISLLNGASARSGSHNACLRHHKAEILKHYAQYADHFRFPNKLPGKPAATLQDALSAKYKEGRQSKGEFAYIGRRPRADWVKSCGYCGDSGLASVDHYLPQDSHIWYTVYSANLIPCCTHCQSVKGSRLAQRSPGERPIHPFFDKIGQTQTLVVWTTIRSSKLSDTSFEVGCLPVSKSPRRHRKLEERLYKRHWSFFRFSTDAVFSNNCANELNRLRARLDEEIREHPGTERVAWLKRHLAVQRRKQTAARTSFLYVALLRGLLRSPRELILFLASDLPLEEATRLNPAQFLVKVN